MSEKHNSPQYPATTSPIQFFHAKKGLVETDCDIMEFPVNHPIPSVVEEDVLLRKPPINTVFLLNLEEEVLSLGSLGDALIFNRAPRSVA